MRIIKFTKMHGLGNDFVIVKEDQLNFVDKINNFAKSVGNRKTGIGCDQFIVYKFEQPNLCEMTIYNADGTYAEACGNGTRCLASLIYEKYSVKELKIKTGSRIIHSQILGSEVAVNMGKPNFQADWIPDKNDLFDILNLFSISFKEVEYVDMGNPHLVIISNEINQNDRKILIDKINSSNLFKNGVNIGFAKIVNNMIDLYVWERGVGYSFACGSGACAGFAAAEKLGFVKDAAYVKFELGSLKLNYDNGDIVMTGPTTKIISGDYYYESK